MGDEDQLDQRVLVDDSPLQAEEAGGSTPQGEHHDKEGLQTSTRSDLDLINDLNSTAAEIKTGANALTSAYIENTSREALHTRQLELKTLEDLYMRDYRDLIGRTSTTDAFRDTMVAHKNAVENNVQRIKNAFLSSRFERAKLQVKNLDALVEKVENGQAGLTSEYLKITTAESLSLKNDQHIEAYKAYTAAFSAIDVANLTPAEVATLTEQKTKVDRAFASIRKFFMEEIAKKNGTYGQDEIDPQVGSTHKSGKQGRHSAVLIRKPASDSTNNGSPSGSSEPDQDGQTDDTAQEKAAEKLASVTRELKELKERAEEEKRATNEQIKSLEKKLEDRGKEKNTLRQDSEISGLWYNEEGQSGSEIQQTERAIVQLKLDAIQLPFFNGDLTTWEAFRDLFDQLVDKSTKLSNTVKFHQLRTHLKGVAFDTIRGYQLTGSNYQAAWNDVKKRFDRKEDLVDEYIRKFLEIPAILHRPNFMSLRHVIDTTNQMIRALPHLGVEVSQWDPFIELIIGMKLDDETRHEWKQKKGPHAKANVKETLEWLETRAFELQPTQTDRLSRLLKSDTRRPHPTKKIFQVNEKGGLKPPNEKPKKCLICGGPHKIRDCTKFKNECAKARTEIIKSLKLCFKCLLKHQLGMCEQEDCNYCGKPHNIMLCYKKENDNTANRQQHGKSGTSPRTTSATPVNGQSNEETPSTSKNYNN